MQRNATRKQRNVFNKVFDGRNRRIRGLWERNGVFYAQMRVAESKSPTKVKIEHAQTVPQAEQELQALKKQKREGTLVVEKQAGIPDFTKAADDYLAEIKELKSKGAATIKRETSSLNHLKDFMGKEPVNKIIMKLAFEYAKWRMDGDSGVGGRAVDVDIIALRHVLKREVREGHIKQSPIAKWSALAENPEVVRLVTTDELETMKGASLEDLKHGRQFSDYLELLAASGGREQETLRLRWSVNVNWDRRLLGFGLDNLSKFGKKRWVPFNTRLEKILREMQSRKEADCDWLFKSPRTAKHLTSFKGALISLKEILKAKQIDIGDVGFHHFRHYFISHAVMSGIDFKTISEWVGHEDGGVLIGNTYAHLSSGHSQVQAQRLSFNN